MNHLENLRKTSKFLYYLTIIYAKTPTIFEKNFEATSVPFFIPDFNLLSCRLY